MHWNEISTVDEMTGEVMLRTNDGPFLDATAGGTGSFTLELGSDLVPPAQRGSLAITFVDGFITQADATGIFETLVPRQGVDGSLPMIGTPALIDSLPIGNTGTDGQFSLAIDTGPQRGVSDIAACSEGVHVTVGAGVDSVQTFSVQPTNRDPLQLDASLPMGDDRVPRPCLGPISGDAEFLFGNLPTTDHELTLVEANDSPSIDRFARLDLTVEESHKTLSLNRPPQDADVLQTPNVAPGETRRWNAKVDVRDTGAANTGIQVFAIGLVDVASHGDVSDPGFTLFAGQTNAITFSVGRSAAGINGEAEDVSVQLFVDGVRRDGADIAPDVISNVDWNQVELSAEEQSNSTRFQLHVVGADTTTTMLDTTLDDVQLSDAGYRLAVGSRTIFDTAGGHDFDNLVLSYQQNGDVDWDTDIDGDDVVELTNAVANQLTDNIFDTNYDGLVDVMDIQVVEDLVPNKLPGDANFDGRVDFPDFLALSEAFGQDTRLWSRGDFDRNGRVDFPDFLILSQNFGAVVNAEPTSVPEPSSSFAFGLLVTMLHTLRASRTSQARNQMLSLGN